jgi:predicted nuclease of predicted toxin-antitoxin system
LKLIVDEDLASRSLVEALRSRLADDAVLLLQRGLSDSEVWQLAQRERRAILTQNARDFAPIAAETQVVLSKCLSCLK